MENQLITHAVRAYYWAMSAIDPHAHTLASDGTCSPTELVETALRAGLTHVGITDHDTLAGWEEAERTAHSLGVGLIRGAEVSATWQRRSVHILALLPDPENAALAASFERTRKSRENRIEEMVAAMARDFPQLSFEAVAARGRGGTLGRPHLADELVALGYVPTRSAAFESILSPSGPYYVPQDVPDVTHAVELIRGAGGVPVLAHPQARGRSRPLASEVVEEMVDAGLAGIEVHHRDHDEPGIVEAQRLAEKFGLLVTGGSDFHGTGKPNRLGENLTAPEVLAEINEQGSVEVINFGH